MNIDPTHVQALAAAFDVLAHTHHQIARLKTVTDPAGAVGHYRMAREYERLSLLHHHRRR